MVFTGAAGLFWTGVGAGAGVSWQTMWPESPAEALPEQVTVAPVALEMMLMMV